MNSLEMISSSDQPLVNELLKSKINKIIHKAMYHTMPLGINYYAVRKTVCHRTLRQSSAVQSLGDLKNCR